MKPVIALVGRPNVGKSTLFNRLTKSRDAIVADFAGLTRDRHYGEGRIGSRAFIAIDTGGFEPDCTDGIFKEMAKQTRQAVAEADAVIFVVDARNGLSAQDHDIARYLRTANKKVLLAANKAEGMQSGPQLAEFYELGIGEPIPVSAAHGQGIRSLLDMALDDFFANVDEEDTEDEGDKPIRLAVAGRPNVGKSTLINTWLGEERLVAFDMPGTTRDAISVPFERNGQRFELIDTAGLRRKGRVFEAIEKFSVVKTLQAISDANVVLLLVDATQGVTEQDAHIAGFVLESGRAVVIAVNKWDAVDSYQREMLQRSIETRLSFLKFAPVLHISAIKRQGLGPLWKAISDAWASATRKMSTPVLTRLLAEAVQFQQPKRAGAFRPKLRYAHQGGQNPPVIVIHGNSLEHVSESYKRFLEGRFREHFKLTGTPLRIEMKSSHNPFDDKD
ncbi:ribosome biogenesis GTPase Der [uncultured Aquabacterium sp.]|uniref:ribosome biogenesis GTPase Der n=1 Tax=uncultured Aquabacterium sp. TaxID=158753 RepID=UPI0025E3F889|nr:ribosome biogenesis GTPase Der [uncultured Aquabacterium sp.]